MKNIISKGGAIDSSKADKSGKFLIEGGIKKLIF